MKTGIFRLTDNDRDELTAHLLALNPEDRYYRFFCSMKDSLIESMVESMTMKGIYGYYILGSLAAVAFMVPASTDSVEFAVSVDRRWRGHGLAKLMLKYSLCSVEAENAREVLISHLHDNVAMGALSRPLASRTSRDGSEINVWIDLDRLRERELEAQGALCGAEA